MTATTTSATGQRRAPRMGIGLPVYNAERYLAEAIEAHLAQSFGDFELLVSDNGSTDGTWRICQHYAAKDPRVVGIRHDVNRGLSWNHQFAFENTRGEFFRWGAADDLPSPGLLQECADLLAADHRLVLVVPDTRNIGEAGEAMGTLERTLDLRREDVVERTRAILTRGYQMVFLQGLMRREAVMATSRRWNYFGWDFILLLELALLGGLAQTTDAWLNRRLHRDQASRVQRDLRAGVRKVEPGFGTTILMPHWRWSFERLRAVLRAPEGIGTRARLAALVARHTWWSRSALADDLRANIRYLTGSRSEAPF
ncbi:glycosyltransferase family 2 protein [Betaproteobacteria bacterium PRO7]|nr:glycosyltransferase family 2 protein [Betaproteobacteria bacterium PRO7]